VDSTLSATRRFRAQFSQTWSRVSRLMRARPRLSAAIVIVVFGVVGTYIGYVINQSPTSTAPNGSAFGDPSPPANLAAALAEVLAEEECLPPDRAEAAIRASLVELGLTGWDVTPAPGARDASCVSAWIDTVGQEIHLSMALHPDVKTGLEDVADQLLRECRTKDEAADLVRSVLIGAGEDGWELRTDGGIAGPSDRKEEIRQHVADGCWIYAGTGWTADGTRLYWIGGR
jgi:hypothetical protein